jgi:hypothetical protein
MIDFKTKSKQGNTKQNRRFALGKPSGTTKTEEI